MEINIVGRHMRLYESVKDYAYSKASKLDRFYDQIQHVDMTLSMDGDEKVVEVIIKSRVGGQIVGKEKHEDFFAAIDLLIDKMSRQLKKQKEKLKVNPHKDSSASGRMAAQGGEPGAGGEDLESYDEVIEKTSF